MRRLLFPLLGLVVGLVAVQDPIASAADPAGFPDRKELDSVLDKAIAYLKTAQAPDGSVAAKFSGPGITSLVAAGLIRHGRADDPVLLNALKYLESNVQKDGGIYSKGLANYTTCLGLMAFQEANKNGKYDTVITNATKFLKGLQRVGDASDPASGGMGYGNKADERPDLSNTHYFVEALIAAGVPKDDPAVQRALAFVSKCQNLPSEQNTLEYAKKATDDDKGGFVYNPLAEPDANNPKATPQGGLRSEGGMTYAGLKSFLYAGVSKDDPRVKAAVRWVREHYTLKENPGQKDAGLYYYYHTFAKAMDALGEDPFLDAKGTPHRWRKELFDELKSRQRADGSWANDNRAFLENLPELSTAFAILSLSHCRDR